MSAAKHGQWVRGRREMLTDELKGVRSEIARLRDQAKNDRQSRKRAAAMTHRQQQLAAAVYVMSSYNVALAARQVLSYQKFKTAGTTQLEAERLVEDIFQKLPDGFAASIAMPEDAATSSVAAEARRFLAAAATAAWVQQENLQHGVAPSSIATRSQYDRLLGQSSEVTASSPKYRNVKKWVSRWQRRWRAKRGSLRRQERLCPEQVAAKESLMELAARRNLLANAVQFLGPFSGPGF